MDKVTCRECLRRRDYELTVTLRRQGGGSYNRRGRNYLGSYCLECVEYMGLWLPTRKGEIDTTGSHSRISVFSIVGAIAEFIDRGVSDLDEERWRSHWPDSGHGGVEFEDYFPLLRRSIEDVLTRRAQFRADETAKRG